MREVRDYFARELKGLSRASLASFATMLLERCDLTVIVPKDIASGYRTFVSTNFRGKPLSTTDIIKADLFGLIEPGERKKLNERWMALVERLEPHPDRDEDARKAASFDNLLSYVHKLRARPGTGIFQGIAELAASTGDPAVFITDVLEPLGDIMLEIKRASYSNGSSTTDINRELTVLNWLPANDWVPIGMVMLHAHPRRAGEEFNALRLLQRLAYSFLILGHGGAKREGRYREVLKAVGDRRAIADPGHPLAFAGNEDSSVAGILTNSLYRDRSSQCRPVLAWIAATGGGEKPLSRLDDFTVEHILPKNATDDAYWRTSFPDPRIRDAAIRSLGNLALVTKAQNGKCQNLPYPEKLKVLHEDGFVSPFDTTLMLKDIADWTPMTVLQRETLMFERVAKAWGLKSPSRSKLGQLLKP